MKTFSLPLILATVVFLAGSAISSGQAPDATGPGVVKEVSPGIYELGTLKIEKEKSRIIFPARVNMDKGVLEYLLVGSQGATHEALLVTDVPVQDVHMAMLLLGAKGAGIHAPAPEDRPPPQITSEYLKQAPELKGDRIFISVQVANKEGAKEIPVEDWIISTKTAKPAARGPWIYNGSMFGADGKFLAESDQSFVALLTYPVALMNNPRKQDGDDSLWGVNEKAIPAVDTPVLISIRLEPQAIKPQ
jgi:hypothetical protein